jgi:hypothetical protein
VVSIISGQLIYHTLKNSKDDDKEPSAEPEKEIVEPKSRPMFELVGSVFDNRPSKESA